MRLPAMNGDGDYVFAGCTAAILFVHVALARNVRRHYPDLHAELGTSPRSLTWGLPYRLREPANYDRLSLGTKFLANLTIVLDIVLSAICVAVVFLPR